MTVEQLRRKLRGVDPKALVAVRDHDNAGDEINGFVRSVDFMNVQDLNKEHGGWGGEGPAVILQL